MNYHTARGKFRAFKYKLREIGTIYGFVSIAILMLMSVF